MQSPKRTWLIITTSRKNISWNFFTVHNVDVDVDVDVGVDLDEDEDDDVDVNLM